MSSITGGGGWIFSGIAHYSFSEPNVCFTWLQTTKQRAIMGSPRLQIHLPVNRVSDPSETDHMLGIFAAALCFYVLFQYCIKYCQYSKTTELSQLSFSFSEFT